MEQPTPEEIEETQFRVSVKDLREQRKWSQGELARRMAAEGWTDFHQTTISRIEKGARPVRLGEARTLARLLGADVGLMIRWSAGGKILSRFWRDLAATEAAQRHAFQQVHHWEDVRSSLRYSAQVLGEGETPEILNNEQLARLREGQQRAEELLEVDAASLIQGAMDSASTPPVEPSDPDIQEHGELKPHPDIAEAAEGLTDLSDLGIQERAADALTRQHYTPEQWADYVEIRRRLRDPSLTLEQKSAMLDKLRTEGLAEAAKPERPHESEPTTEADDGKVKVNRSARSGKVQKRSKGRESSET